MQTYTEFRFDQWVQRAREFTEGLPKRVAGEVQAEAKIEPPLAASAVDSLRGQLGIPILAALQRFFTTGSAGLDFRYRWTPTGSQAEAIKSIYRAKSYIWGGGEFCQASALVEWFKDCQELAADPDYWLAEYPDDLAFWKQSLPIFRMRSGDYLALDGREPSDDPAVVYLSHDDESKVIASSFTEFLAEWERLYYIGPDSSLLDEYSDDDGLLSAENEKAQILRGAFGDAA